MTPKEEAIRALLLGVLVDDPGVGKGRFGEAKSDAFRAVLDIALIAMGVRSAGIVVIHKSSSMTAMIDSSDETLAKIGVGFVHLTDDGDSSSAVPCYVFTEAKKRSKSQPSLRQLALDHKACFGETDDWSAAQMLPCDKATKERGHPWETAGIAFGYIHPAPRAGLNGGLDFVVEGCLQHNKQITEIMGPQSVALSDPALLPFAVKRCASANKAMRKLIGDVFPDIKVRCVVWSH